MKVDAIGKLGSSGVGGDIDVRPGLRKQQYGERREAPCQEVTAKFDHHRLPGNRVCKGLWTIQVD
jgi:hypothetical protein